MRGRGGHLVFQISLKNTNLEEDIEILLPVKFCWIPFNGFRGEVARRGGAEVADWTLDRKIRVRFPAYPHRVWALWWQGGKRRLLTSQCPCRGRLGTIKTPSCPSRGCPAAGQNLETGHLSRHYIAEISLNVTLNHNQQQPTEENSKMSQPNQRPGQPSCFSDQPENTNLVEDVEILLPVTFRWILFSCFRGEVENVSANKTPGRPSCFSDRPGKHKLGRGH